MEYSTISVHRYSDGVATLCLNRPRVRNCMNWDMLEEIIVAMRCLDEDEAVRAVVVYGEGKHFCAGIDYSIFRTLAEVVTDETVCPGMARRTVFSRTQTMQDTCSAFEACSKPVIAAVHGVCTGAGVDLVTACDIRICSSGATFCVKEVDVGVTADMGTLQRLPGIIGDGRARELALTARVVPATEALAYGLVTAIVQPDTQPQPKGSRQHAAAPSPEADAVRTHALALARELAAKPVPAAAGTKGILLRARGRPVEEGLREVALLNSATLWSHDLRTAMEQGARAMAKL
eukprot:jgi/Ulvmu1/2363/UM013_0211.1